jgi:hypothetical protein
MALEKKVPGATEVDEFAGGLLKLEIVGLLIFFGLAILAPLNFSLT